MRERHTAIDGILEQHLLETQCNSTVSRFRPKISAALYFLVFFFSTSTFLCSRILFFSSYADHAQHQSFLPFISFFVLCVPLYYPPTTRAHHNHSLHFLASIIITRKTSGVWGVSLVEKTQQSSGCFLSGGLVRPLERRLFSFPLSTFLIFFITLIFGVSLPARFLMMGCVCQPIPWEYQGGNGDANRT